MSKLKRILTVIMGVFVLNCSAYINVYALEGCGKGGRESLDYYIMKALEEKNTSGVISDETTENILDLIAEYKNDNYYSGEHVIEFKGLILDGYGETHYLSKGWSYRVDKPAGGEAKPHVHVDNKKRNI